MKRPPIVSQVEAAQRRAPFAERKEKKRKRTQDGATTAGAAQDAGGSPPLPADVEVPVMPKRGASKRKGPGPAAKAAAAPASAEEAAAGGVLPLTGTGVAQRPVKRQRRVASDATRGKQQLVRTVALGNLSPDVRAQAVAHAQSIGQVRSHLCPSGAS